MKTMMVVLAILALSSVAFAQEQQQDDAQTQSDLYDQQQWFFRHPYFMPHPYFHPHFPHPHFPSLPPMSAPHFPFQHPSNPPPAHGNLSPCVDDFRSFLSTHKYSMSSGCCSALKDVKIPPVQRLVSQYCSGASAPSSS